MLLFVCSSATVYLLDTAKDAFDIILQVGAGTGLLYLVRWFWWRVNAWCEIVAMVSSFGVSLVLLVLARNGVVITTHAALLITIAVTTVCWLLAAYLGPQTDRDVLIVVLPQGAAGRARAGRAIRAERRAAAGRRAARARTSRWRCSAGSPAARRSGRRSSRSATSSTAAPATRSRWPRSSSSAALIVVRVMTTLWSDSGSSAAAARR